MAYEAVKYELITYIFMVRTCVRARVGGLVRVNDSVPVRARCNSQVKYNCDAKQVCTSYSKVA